jgi:hypothetical protein
MIEVKIQGKDEVCEQMVADLVCTAFEGGIGYWAQIIGYKKPEKIFQWGLSDVLGGTVYRYVQYPMSEGGAVLLRDAEGDDKWELNLENIKTGLSVMASKYPRHYQNFINDNSDAITGDVFIQCCLFNELVFG